MIEDERERLGLATLLAKSHRAGDLVFWTSDDWRDMYGVHCTRIDSETVVIRVQHIGKASLDVCRFSHN